MTVISSSTPDRSSDNVGFKGLALLVVILIALTLSLISIYQAWQNQNMTMVTMAEEILTIFVSLYVLLIYINRT